MKIDNRRGMALMLFALFLFPACLFTRTMQPSPLENGGNIATITPGTLAEAPEPSQTPVLPTAISAINWKTDEENVILLWAQAAEASSSASTTNWHADQATGEPDTLLCGDFSTAWKPSESETEAWLDLSFTPPILPSDLVIYQSYDNGHFHTIEVTGVNGEMYQSDADTLPQTLPEECPVGFWISLATVDFPVTSVRIHVERNPQEKWTQIDAVGIYGWTADENLVSDENEIDSEWVDYDDPFTFFSNSNLVNRFVLMDNIAWVASNGGVVQWDIDTRTVQKFDAGDGMQGNAQQAVAFCSIPTPTVFVGGTTGVSMMDLQVFPYWTVLEHASEPIMEAVHALACDEQRQQLWVGYAGHLSRYDLNTQTWIEFDEMDGVPYDVIRQIVVAESEVWVAAVSGLMVVRENGVLQNFTYENSEIPEQMVHDVWLDAEGVLWGASSSGLLRFDGIDWDLLELATISQDALVNVLVEITPAADGGFWLGDVYGRLCRFSPDDQNCMQLITAPEQFTGILTGLAEDTAGRLVVSNDREGLWLMDGSEWHLLQVDALPLGNAFTVIAESPNGTMWLAGKDHLQTFRASQPQKQWQTVMLPENGKPTTFFVASTGIWIGHTAGARFVPYLTAVSIDLPVHRDGSGIRDAVTSIHVDEQGRTWFGTMSGLSIWDSVNFMQVDLLTPQERDANKVAPRVNTIYSNGNVTWVGAVNGLHRFVDGVWERKFDQELLGEGNYNPSVGAMAPTPNRDEYRIAVWNRLLLFDGSTYVEELKLPSEIRTMYRDWYGNYWLATAQDGIFLGRLEGNGDMYWMKFYEEQPFFSQRFGYQSIVMDHQHSLWFASLDAGVVRYLPMGLGQ